MRKYFGVLQGFLLNIQRITRDFDQLMKSALKRFQAAQRFFIGLLTGFPLCKLEEELAASNKQISTLKTDIEELKFIIRTDFNSRQSSLLDEIKNDRI